MEIAAFDAEMPGIKLKMGHWAEQEVLTGHS